MTENNRVGMIGFLCGRDGSSTEFKYCFEKCPKKCYPLPLLYALAENRVLEPNVFSVTEILGPQQPARLKRTKAYFCKPTTRFWATFGTAWHSVVEKYIGKCPPHHKAEERFNVVINVNGVDVQLRGTYDYYDGETLTDWKTMKCYPIKKLRAGDWGSTTYDDQLRIYRHYGCPEAKAMQIVAAIKDWSLAAQARDKIEPVEQIDIPMKSAEEIEALVHKRLELHLSPVDVPCAVEDLWIQLSSKSQYYNKPLRCMEYCEASSQCSQHKKWLENNG